MTIHTLKPLAVVCVLTSLTAGCRSTSPVADEADADLKAVQTRAHERERISPVSSSKIVTKEFGYEHPSLDIDKIEHLNFCSFNISFVGQWRAEEKKSEELAKKMKSCDLVAVQELTAPPLNTALDVTGKIHQWLPKPGSGCVGELTTFEELKEEYCAEGVQAYGEWWDECLPPEGVVKIYRESQWSRGYEWEPDGQKITERIWKQDCQARFFIGAMRQAGFRHVLSKGDTGRSRRHDNSAKSEWSVVFYRPEVLEPIPENDAPSGWTLVANGDGWTPCGNPDPEEVGGFERTDNPISKCLVANPVFDRVPYAFSFRTKARQDGKRLDFTVVNVHLKATLKTTEEGYREAGIERSKEFRAIHEWIAAMKSRFPERDFIITGDTNIANSAELDMILKPVGEGGPNLHEFVSLNDELNRTNIGKEPRPFDHVMLNPKLTPVAESSNGKYELVILDIAHADSFDLDGPKFLGSCESLPPSKRASCRRKMQPQFFKEYSDHIPIMFRMPIIDDDD